MSIGKAWADGAWNDASWVAGAWLSIAVSRPGVEVTARERVRAFEASRSGRGNVSTYRKRVVYQDADETIKYTIYWGPALADGDTIASASFVPAGVTLADPGNDDKTTWFRASGVSGGSGYVTSRVTTVGGDKLDETIYFKEFVS